MVLKNCEKCGRTGIKGDRGLAAHLERWCPAVHGPVQLVACADCGKGGFKGDRGLKAHKRYCKGRDGSTDEGGEGGEGGGEAKAGIGKTGQAYIPCGL